MRELFLTDGMGKRKGVAENKRIRGVKRAAAAAA